MRRCVISIPALSLTLILFSIFQQSSAIHANVNAATAVTGPMKPYGQMRSGSGSGSGSASSGLEIDLTKRLLPSRTNISTNININIRGGAIAGTGKRAGINKSDNGNASLATSVFNLANNVAGAGLLTLSAGKAAGGSGWIPSIAICGSLAYASAFTFILIGKACEITGEKSFKGLWSQAFGEGTAYLVDSIVFLQCFISSTIYIGLLGDIFSALLQGSALAANQPLLASRTGVILLVAASILFPLNLIKDLSALAFTSILGLCAIMYTVAFMVYRALDGSYSTVGRFVVDGLITPPSFDSSTAWNFDLRSLVLVSNLGLAFIAHYNAPTYYRELKKESSETFSKMTRSAYLILASIYVITMCAGYATFGDTARGNILLNYHPKDMLALFGRLATGLSVIFGFPLVSNGAREGLKNAAMALGHPSVSDPKNHVKLVLSVLCMASVLAILVDDIKIIAGFSGAAMGSFLVYICPPIIYSRILLNYFGKDSLEFQRGRRTLAFVPFGVFIAIMGVTMTYKSM